MYRIMTAVSTLSVKLEVGSRVSLQLFLHHCTIIRGTEILILNAMYELAWEIHLAIAQLLMLGPQIFLCVCCVDNIGLCSHSTNGVQMFLAIHTILILWVFLCWNQSCVSSYMELHSYRSIST